jgi:hypothetical protein
MKQFAAICALNLCWIAGSAGSLYAQTSFINPNPYDSGYTITTPGQPNTFVNPNPYGGGYTITTPGRPSTFVNPNPYGGGYTVTTPGQGYDYLTNRTTPGYNYLMNR